MVMANRRWGRDLAAQGLALQAAVLVAAVGVGLALLLLAGMARVAAASAPPAPQVETGTDPRHAYLAVDGVVILDEAHAHLGPLQWRPGGRLVAVAVAPLGTQTAVQARVYLVDVAAAQLVTVIPGFSPEWQADGSLQVATVSGGVMYDPATGQLVPVAQANAVHPVPQAEIAWELVGTDHAPPYPATIRVAHHPSNGCRDVPAWQVDVIPFEEYVARVVPAEVPASWPFDALAAQAVAARTYAWRQILVGRSDYDVTDWANFQMMCDQRYPSTDAAVAATAGQYLSAQDDPFGWPIVAMYSAENGHPTRTNPNVSYLQAVPDLFALGRARWGHGYGLSQWGAFRRAQAGYNYRQILGHYYTGVYLQDATAPGRPLGALLDLGPRPDGSRVQPGSAVRWRPLLPHGMTATLAIQMPGGISVTYPISPAGGLWRPAPEDAGTAYTATLLVAGTPVDQVVVAFDATPPATPTLSLPAVVTGSTIPISVTRPGDAWMERWLGLSRNWVWEGEALYRTPGSGQVVSDTAAANGQALQARAGVDQAGVWYGPYTTLLPPGRTYRALFWLRSTPPATTISTTSFTPTGTLTSARRVARLDVVDDVGNQILGLRDVWPSDFISGGVYSPVAVDFYLFTPPRGLEFRVAWPGGVDLALDRVEVWQLPPVPAASQATVTWPAYGGAGPTAIQAVAFDEAGNPSRPATGQVTIQDEAPPEFGTDFSPQGWQRESAALSATLSVTDGVSGLATGELLVEGPGPSGTRTASFSFPENPWAPQRITASLPPLSDGLHRLQFRATDQSGNVALSSVFTLGVDTTPPTVTAIWEPAGRGPGTSGWYTGPVTVTLQGEDGVSGVAGLWYRVDGAGAQPYTGPVRLESAGIHRLTYWGEDRAGNLSLTQVITAALDLAPPVVLLWQALPPPGAPSGSVAIHWSASDDAAGVERVELASRRGSGEWQAVGGAWPANGSTALPLAPDESVWVRARGIDRLGQTGPWVEMVLRLTGGQLFLPLVQR